MAMSSLARRHAGRRRLLARTSRARIERDQERRQPQPCARRGRLLEECSFIVTPFGCRNLHRRSTTRTPSGPARMAVCARPMNRPCSMTPGMAESACASAAGSPMRPSAASIIQWPPSVTKGWPSLPCRSLSGPRRPGSPRSPFRWPAGSRRKPNGATSIGSGKRPRTSTHLRVVGDHDHARGRGGDDLFPQQRAAAALDQAEVRARSRRRRRPSDRVPASRPAWSAECRSARHRRALPATSAPRQCRGRRAPARRRARRNAARSNRCRARAACPGAQIRRRVRRPRVSGLRHSW